jgi:hypothetical protein
MITHELINFGLNDMKKIVNFNLFQTMNIFQINDIIIKMDNYEHQIQHFSVGVDLEEVVTANQCHKPFPPPPTICKMGLVCRHDSSTTFSMPRV